MSMEFIKQENGNYEWGFDLTDFNDEHENNGADKFKTLLQDFNLKLVSSEEMGVVWKNKDMSVVTANNPLTGKYYDKSECKRGFLGYVGISCNSSKLLQDFINTFRRMATYIKNESNKRDYI